ncbi:MAG: SH3 domain-containing protein [Bacteroidia bacterium]|nr:SH3 domain-containing protein [Bacteroidia bacterium]
MRWILGFGIVLGFWGCEPAPKGEMELAQAFLLRSSPSPLAQVIDTLPAGALVSRLKEAGDWIYVCYRGIRGWIAIDEASVRDYIEGEALDNSLILAAAEDSVAAEVAVDGASPRYVRVSELQPWFAPDSHLYAGFYEGLPGEELGLVIVNYIPSLAILAKVTRLDPETMEVAEEQFPMGPELRRESNLLFVEEEEAPFRKAEFIRWGSRRGLLIERSPGNYSLLWRRSL